MACVFAGISKFGCMLFVVALWNRADHYILIPLFLSFYLLLFSSPKLSGRTLDVYHTSKRGVALVSVNLECKSNVLQAARWKCRTQKVAKNRHLGTIAQICRAISSQLRHVSTIGKIFC